MLAAKYLGLYFNACTSFSNYSLRLAGLWKLTINLNQFVTKILTFFTNLKVSYLILTNN